MSTGMFAWHREDWIDPADGYICNRRFKREWEENDYVSLKGTHPNFPFKRISSKLIERTY